VEAQKNNFAMKNQTAIQVDSPKRERPTGGMQRPTSISLFVLTTKGEKILGAFENEKKRAIGEKQNAKVTPS
jgi:hypothetical protein